MGYKGDWYLTKNKHGRHIQYANVNEDNYVCNVETNDKDAQRIIRCVNNFDNLLEACKCALTNLEYYVGNKLDDYKDRYLLKININKLEQAINKAEKIS